MKMKEENEKAGLKLSLIAAFSFSLGKVPSAFAVKLVW